MFDINNKHSYQHRIFNLRMRRDDKLSYTVINFVKQKISLSVMII